MGKLMTILIVPDIHHHTENAEYWLKVQKFDRAIFLGDYFDDHDDNANDARKTALWLRDRMDATEDVFLLGNHDAAYLFPHCEELYCPGFTKAKSQAIRETLLPKHWHRFKLAHEEQGWLLSHAGFHPAWIDAPTVPKILQRCETAMALAASGKVDPILAYGETPGGVQRFGGPLWMAWENFLPIPGINQVVGHSTGECVREQNTDRSRNVCIDVENASVATILTNGELRILDRANKSHNRDEHFS